jgi:hypothetical protein
MQADDSGPDRVPVHLYERAKSLDPELLAQHGRGLEKGLFGR